MEKITLADIERYTGGERKGSALISSVSIDSRKITDECLFIGIKGENFDGNDFALKAIENRAMAVLTDRDIINASSIKVKDTNKALLDLANGYRDKFTDLKAVAVTGSVGKTTTKEMIYSILCKMGKSLKNEGNLNNHIGTPLTVLNLTKKHEYGVFELGMSVRGEIEPLAKLVKPNVSVITNICMSHIEFLGSREEIAREKLDILKGTKDTIVLNGDEPLLRNVKTDIDIIYYGITGENLNIKASNIKNLHDRTIFDCSIYGQKNEIIINTPGTHNVYNALAAMATCLSLGATKEQIKQGLLEFKNADMRQNMYIYNGFKVIEDCYNASSPDAMCAAIDLIKYLNEPEKHIILGQMGELGAFSKDAHKQVLAYAQKISDNIYLYGSEWEGLELKNAILFNSKEDIAKTIKPKLNPNSAVLVKGSRFTKMEDVIKYIKG